MAEKSADDSLTDNNIIKRKYQIITKYSLQKDKYLYDNYLQIITKNR